MVVEAADAPNACACEGEEVVQVRSGEESIRSMEPSLTFDRQAYIIDDDPALRRLVRRVLTDAGIISAEFDSAEAFLAGPSERPIGCILLDMRLPGMDGLELLDRLREAAVPSPVIMLSGHGDIPSAVRAVKTGAFDFVQKPFRKDELLETVNRAFDLIRSLQESPSGRIAVLSPREKEVLFAFADGAANKVVALRLGLSPRTVEMHRARILQKLDVKNLTQALFLAKEGGFIR